MASLPAGSRDATPIATSEGNKRHGHDNRPSSRQGDPSKQTPPRPNVVSHSRGPVSPPPLKRLGSVASLSANAESVIALPSDQQPQFTGLLFAVVDANLDIAMRRRATPPPSAVPGPSEDRSAAGSAPSVADMAGPSRWPVDDMTERLKVLRKEAREGHAQMTAHAIASTKAVERRIFTGRDLFASVKKAPVAEKKGQTMRIKFKQHLKSRKDHKEEHYDVVCVKTEIEAVPPYRFHHVEIRKNILSPNTTLAFVPHLRDLEGDEEVQYNIWLQGLENDDLKCGFNPLNRHEKSDMTLKAEKSASILLHLDSWLSRLAIPHLTRSSLNQYMAARDLDDAMTPQQKAARAKSQQKGGHMTDDAIGAAEVFASAFRRIFVDGLPDRAAISLKQVLEFAKSRESVMDIRPAAKDGASQEENDIEKVVESSLGTYCILGCLICFSHSCEHGEFDKRNWKKSLSLDSYSSLADIMKHKRSRRRAINDMPLMQCERKCYRRGIISDAETQLRGWTEDERNVLRSLYITSENSKVKMDPICLAAEILNRDCNDVFAEFDRLGIERPEARPSEPARPRNLPWFDRDRKMLLGDWQDHTVTHEYQLREVLDPCLHDGPCAPKICSCVDAGVLCEKFCGCTVDTCAYKFTGCACHGQGKACHAKQKDRPCICLQLNRECDPELCKSCGAMQSADPRELDLSDRAAGCQNCELQRGPQTTLLLGQSQLEGVGYGTFTAEDIAQDEFVIEYVGELILHDEGVRREGRRGNVFDEASNTSYIFTLLDHEGIWVDAAIYGNLSRYINHASEHDTRGCNITPRILYVNGEYRIKFTALRDIKAGEELFFNYGENFPNLTKKLLDNKAAEKPVGGGGGGGGQKPRVGRPRRTEASDRVARKAPRLEDIQDKRAKTARKTVVRLSTSVPYQQRPHAVRHPERPKRRRHEDSDVNDEYQPRPDAAVGSEDDDDDDDPYEAARRQAKRSRGNAQAARPFCAREDERGEENEEGEEDGGRAVRGGREGEGREGGGSDPPPKKRIQRVMKRKRGGARAGSGRPRKIVPPEPGPGRPLRQGSTTAAAGGAGAGVASSLSSSSSARHDRAVARRSDPVEVIVIEDSDDQDVVIRTRAARTRRMPAKFRDDDVQLH